MLQNRKTKPDDKFWIIHGCIFRPAFGQVTSGEMVDTSSGIRTTLPDCDSNLANEITPHPAPLASTRDDQDWHISEIQGKESEKHASCSSRYPAQTIMTPEDSVCPRYVLPFLTYHLLPARSHMQKHVKGGPNSSHLASPTRLISSKVMAAFLHSATSKGMSPELHLN
jgi:hypothetical protein